MDKELILTFDIGTQSMRGMIVDKSGSIIDIQQCVYESPYYSQKPLWAEQKPDLYFEVLCSISKILKQRNPEIFEKGLLAMAITCFRDSVLCLDANNKPLRDMVMWLDKREANEDKLPKIPVYKKILFAIAGVKDIVSTQRKQSICNWIMTEQPDIWEKTSKFVLLSTYLNWQLTGVLLDSKANQIAHIPFDSKNKKWQKKRSLTRFIYDVPEEKLCDVCDSGDVIGTITDKVSELSGIPKGLELIATGSDKGCETLGLSVNSADKAAISFGTAATIDFSTDRYFEPLPFAPGYPAVINNKWNPEIQIYRGYWMLSWFKKEFASEEQALALEKGVSVEEILNSHLHEVPAGCNGLVLQPFWGPGVCTPNARGSIVGFSDIHTKYHLYRAIIEGINYALLDGLKRMEKRGKTKIKEIYIGGGGSKSFEICQIAADMFGLPVKCIQTHEASGLGSSIVAFVAKGVFKSFDEAIEKMIHISKVFEPDMEKNELYMKYYKDVYVHIYPKLLPLFRRIKRI